MRRAFLLLLLTGLPLAGAAQGPASPPQGPILRASVDQVVVDVVVTDADGQPVSGLTAADFELRDRGKAQTIDTFAEVSLPLPPPRSDGSPLPVPSDVRSNTADDGRIYVIVFDDLHVAVDRTPIVQRLVRDLLARYTQPNDLVAVTTTSGLGETAREPTPDLSRIEAAVARFAGQGSDPISHAAIRRARTASQNRNEDPMKVRRTSTTLMVDGSVDDNDDSGVELRERAALALRSLTAAADALATIPGRRKTVLFFSEGMPISPRDGEMADARARLLGAAARANVTIHAIDPKGLDHALSGPVSGFEVQLRLMRAATLREISEGTGGTARIDANNLQPGLVRVVAESSRYYLLGYAPPDAARNGRFRTLDVRVKNPALRVSARRGYREPDDDAARKAAAKAARTTAAGTAGLASGPLAALIRRPVATRGLPLTAQAAVFPSAAGNVRVILELGAGAVRFETDGARETAQLDVAIVPVSAAGDVLPSIEARMPLALDAATAQEVRDRGVRIVQAATLPPGDYQLRIAVRDPARDVAGAVICEVTVPDPNRRGLRLSELVLSSTQAGTVPSVSRDEDLERGLGGRPPTTVRAFGAGETVSAYAEVVDGRRDGGRDVTLVTIVRDGRGRDVVRHPQAGARAVPAGQPFGYAADLPLRALVPGRYVLRVEAQVAGITDAAREVPFEVRP
jgi:VWFA-related protein